MRRTGATVFACLLALPVLAQPRSGYEFASPETQAIQDDDFANPGMLWVEQGAGLWARPEGAAGKACADCHGAAQDSMRGVAARYPAYDAATQAPLDLLGRIERCRTQNMGAPPLPPGDDGLVALATYVAHQSRGLPLAVDASGPMAPVLERGAALYRTRRGQFNLACTQCHDQRPGEMVRGERLSQGQINGFPAYLKRWSRVGTVHQRFQLCDQQARAEPLPLGHPDYLALEVYVAHRGRGLPIETPAVRR